MVTKVQQHTGKMAVADTSVKSTVKQNITQWFNS